MPRETTSPASWSVGTLISALESGERSDGEASRVIKIPQFQRNITWGPDKQQKLIDSIHNGFPIGSLMLYQKSGTTDQKEYLLVDGLQRANSIWNYKKEPMKFFSLNRVGNEIAIILEKITSLANSDIRVDELLPVLENWRTQTKTLNRSDGFDSFNLLTNISSKFGIDPTDLHQLSTSVQAFLDSIETKVNIDSQEIPVIIYEGDPKYLPEIFERINTGSVQLSKYQILAAQWIDKSVRTENQGIIDAVMRKNRSLEDKGFVIERWDTNRTEFEFSLYEYLFGLGKVLAEDYPLLFSSKAAHEEESIAFALATMMCKLPISKMSNIENELFDGSRGSLELEKFSAACNDAATFVESTLEPYIGLKLNARKQTHAHSVNQIISIISRCIVGKYDTDNWSLRDSWNDEKGILHKSICQHYIVDLIEKNWRGSGDSRLFNMTWKQSTEGEYSPSNHYLGEFTAPRMTAIMDNWFDNQLQSTEIKRVNASDPVKMFLKFLYCESVSYRSNSSRTYEIEHLFPVSRLVGLFQTNQDDGWPINCIANLALFIDSTNRDKSNHTLTEYLDRLDDGPRAEVIEQLDQMLFCNVSDVAIPLDGGEDKWEKEQYKDFLLKRFATMRNQVIDNLELEEEIQSQTEVDNYSEEGIVEEEMTYIERGEITGELDDIIVSPSSTFFTFGFTIPVEQTQIFIAKFALSENNKRESITLTISGQEYDSRIRYQQQRKREVVQFNFLVDAKRALVREFQQSYLDVEYNAPPSEKCVVSHTHDNAFVITKRN